MRNLLSEQFKHSLRGEYLLRLGIVFGWLLTTAFCIGILTLIPSFVFTTARHSTLEDQHRLMQAKVGGVNTEEGGEGAPVALLRERLEVLAASKDKQRLTEALLSVLTYRGDAIALTSISYSKASGETQLSIKGTALSRDALLSFEQALEEDDRFDSVDLPVSNLARERDILFDITLKGSF